MSDANIKTCEMYLATDAAGPGGALPGSMAVSSNVYAVSSDADRMGKPPIVVYRKSTLAEQTAPAALALTVVSKSGSAVSFGNLDLDVNHVGGGVSWSPPVSDVNIKTYESYLATDAAGSGGALAGRMAVATYGYAVSCETDGTGKSHIVVYIESTMAGQTTQAALAPTLMCPCASRSRSEDGLLCAADIDVSLCESRASEGHSEWHHSGRPAVCSRH